MAQASVIKVPGYIIKQEIGSGGMATVYLATQTSLEREVALKVISASLATDEAFSKRFLREARTIASLAHPNIVSIYEVGVTPEHLHYFSMQHLPGGDFASRLAAGIEERELIRVLVGILRALGFAHRRGFVHRDVSPGNILFDESGNPVLTDFGIARAVRATSRITSSGASVGTSHYMSPEQARGGEVDARTDLYSLGALTFEALTGEPPYDGPDGFAVAYKHVFEPIPRLPAEFSHWQGIIDRSLAKDPAERYHDSDEFLQALAEVFPDHAGVILADLSGGAPLPQAESPAPRARSGVQPSTRVSRNTGKVAPSGQAANDSAAPGAEASRRPGWPLVLLGLGGAGIIAAGVLAWMGRNPPAIADSAASPTVASTQAPVDPAPVRPSTVSPTRPAAEPRVRQPVQREPVADVSDDADSEVSQADGRRFGLEVSDQEILEELPGLVHADETEPPPADAALESDDPIERALAQGRAHLTAQRLLTPPGQNAVESFRQALRLDAENAQARAGLAEVVGRYLDLADRVYERGALNEAAAFLARAAQVARETPGTPSMDQVSERRDRLKQPHREAAQRAEAAWDRAAAAQAWEQVLALDPDDSLAPAGIRRAQQLGLPGFVFSDRVGPDKGPELVIVGKGPARLRGAAKGGEVGVEVPADFAIMRGEVTVEQFSAFANATGLARKRHACRDRESVWRSSKDRDWLEPGFSQTPRNPVVCVSFADARAYGEWLSAQTGKRYRLPSEVEWERALGDAPTPDCARANLADRSHAAAYDEKQVLACDDGHAATAPAGSFAGSEGPVYDMSGNVREWTADCMNDAHAGRSMDARPRQEGDCRERVVKGLAWISTQGERDPSRRVGIKADLAQNTVGFRLVRELTGSP